MTQTEAEHKQLKATLLQGCNGERFDLINMMWPEQKAEFVMGLTFAPSDPNRERTWQMLAISLAGDLLDMIRQQNQPAVCADPCNAACECVPCEMKKAASPAELAAPEAIIMNTDSLQEIH